MVSKIKLLTIGGVFAAATYVGFGLVLREIDKTHAKLGNPNVNLAKPELLGGIYAPFDFDASKGNDDLWPIERALYSPVYPEPDDP